MYVISKQFTFSASHELTGLPEGHQCGRLHGHNYTVEVALASATLNQHGFIVDYGDLKPFKEWLDNNFDHRHLNEVVNFQPSAENLAEFFYGWCANKWPQTVAVRVSETDKTWAEYKPGA